MPWEYILKIKLDNDIVYKRDIDEKENLIQEKDEELYSINNASFETIANVEVLKHGRKR
ncbi:hypothetical protein CBE01nite_08890 [Clostridium beijerinckii]|uniref:Uncharacterized protein n=1 Tax=Clostridium beijerinckii TaxID=1520 RepID=A0AB74VIC5_CLOBE|nr:hypothetical protein [Clostridium beijerinckii]NRZ25355.1 hypothetical protein [Clostridium beijerinckii]NYB97872.1 hypothetical protein [Clostridium beijerinckii]OOM25855.1 hypothetical protein CLBEI_13720 [Clostridium beijerinckii]QUN36127.1 hypothetical protein KEC93_04715 [Clostridium beijerinckii]SQB13176.1 Uncharacterised protein [Clostridium beijerinckii]